MSEFCFPRGYPRVLAGVNSIHRQSDSREKLHPVSAQQSMCKSCIESAEMIALENCHLTTIWLDMLAAFPFSPPQMGISIPFPRLV